MLKYADIPEQLALARLGTSSDGLSEEEAASRLEKMGKNTLESGKKTSVFALFLSQFGDVITLLLIGAAIISAVIALFSGESSDVVDTAIITCIIFLNAVVGTVQHYRADRAIEGLKRLSAPMVKVRRDGQIARTDASNLVVGDIVCLEEGDVVPADMRIISANSLRCDQATLTGESLGVEKRCGVVAGTRITHTSAYNLLFSSTYVVGGSCEGVVTATGKDTEIGAIAEMLTDVRKSATPLERALNRLGKIISAFVIAVAAIIFIVGAAFRGTGIIENFMTAVAVAVAAIPEGLPAVESVIMAMGVQHMSRENVVIRKLKCVETLGGCSTICTDKTGTLTRNELNVEEVYPRSSGHMLRCMAACNRVKERDGFYFGDPTEVALRRYAAGCGEDVNVFSVTGEIAFTSERKLMSVRAEFCDGQFILVKGAPERVLDLCTHYDFGDGERRITGSVTEEVRSHISSMAADALRVLAFAYKRGGELTEDGLTFLGVCGMSDGLKDGVARAVEECRQAGITTVMITGDSPETALAIARKAGIAKNRDEVVTGDELDAMTKPQLKDAVRRARVFARVSPRHKNIIVKLKKAAGEVVAMTGDGVNDAPSVKSADVGIAMGKSGTDVTKSVADMVIADDNFTTIVTAVREGRRISSNIRKTIQFFLSTNLAEVFAILAATIFFFKYDFLPSTLLLWINLVTDSFPVLALGAEGEDFGAMQSPPVRAERALFSRGSLFTILCSSLYIMGVTVAVYAATLFSCGNVAATTMAFLTLSGMELFHAFNVRAERGSAFGRGMLSNRVLLVTFAAGVAVNILLCATPVAPLFGLVNPTMGQWLMVLGASASILPFAEGYKLVLAAYSARRRAKMSGGGKAFGGASRKPSGGRSGARRRAL